MPKTNMIAAWLTFTGIDGIVEQAFDMWVLIPIAVELAIITWWVTRP